MDASFVMGNDQRNKAVSPAPASGDGREWSTDHDEADYTQIKTEVTICTLEQPCYDYRLLEQKQRATNDQRRRTNDELEWLVIGRSLFVAISYGRSYGSRY